MQFTEVFESEHLSLDQFERWVRQRWPRELMFALQFYDDTEWLGEDTSAIDRLVAIPVLGMAGETGEMIDHFKKAMRDRTYDSTALKLEIGDALHYLTVLSYIAGFSLEEIAAGNVRKLQARDEAKGGTYGQAV